MPNYTYTYPNTNLQSITGAQIQNPYGNNNNMLMNLPYNNGSSYMAQGSNSPNQFLKCRPVSSKDEARAYQIDLDGSLWVFTDVGNGKIYTKQVNNDGTATFKTYAFTQDEAYLQELSSDITEMIKDASPEERNTLRQKMTTLASKIN